MEDVIKYFIVRMFFFVYSNHIRHELYRGQTLSVERDGKPNIPDLLKTGLAVTYAKWQIAETTTEQVNRDISATV